MTQNRQTKLDEAIQLRRKSSAITRHVAQKREATERELAAMEAVAQAQLVLAAALELRGPFERVV